MNDKNLIPNSERTPSELREMTQKGGKKSGEARRRKRDMREKMKTLLSLGCADNDKASLETLGLDPEYYDNEMVLVAAMFMRAAAGDTKAFDKVMQILGEDVASRELKLKKKELKRKMKPNGEQGEEIPQLYKALTEDDDK